MNFYECCDLTKNISNALILLLQYNTSTAYMFSRGSFDGKFGEFFLQFIQNYYFSSLSEYIKPSDETLSVIYTNDYSKLELTKYIHTS